jgi:hypothetical protein
MKLTLDQGKCGAIDRLDEAMAKKIASCPLVAPEDTKA